MKIEELIESLTKTAAEHPGADVKVALEGHDLVLLDPKHARWSPHGEHVRILVLESEAE